LKSLENNSSFILEEFGKPHTNFYTNPGYGSMNDLSNLELNP